MTVTGACPGCGLCPVNLQVMCLKCKAPASYDKQGELRAWKIWQPTWWKPWTWFRFRWAEIGEQTSGQPAELWFKGKEL